MGNAIMLPPDPETRIGSTFNQLNGQVLNHPALEPHIGEYDTPDGDNGDSSASFSAAFASDQYSRDYAIEFHADASAALGDLLSGKGATDFQARLITANASQELRLSFEFLQHGLQRLQPIVLQSVYDLYLEAKGNGSLEPFVNKYGTHVVIGQVKTRRFSFFLNCSRTIGSLVASALYRTAGSVESPLGNGTAELELMGTFKSEIDRVGLNWSIPHSTFSKLPKLFNTSGSDLTTYYDELRKIVNEENIGLYHGQTIGYIALPYDEVALPPNSVEPMAFHDSEKLPKFLKECAMQQALLMSLQAYKPYVNSTFLGQVNDLERKLVETLNVITKNIRSAAKLNAVPPTYDPVSLVSDVDLHNFAGLSVSAMRWENFINPNGQQFRVTLRFPCLRVDAVRLTFNEVQTGHNVGPILYVRVAGDNGPDTFAPNVNHQRVGITVDGDSEYATFTFWFGAPSITWAQTTVHVEVALDRNALNDPAQAWKVLRVPLPVGPAS